MESRKYYEVDANKLEQTLIELGKQDFLWREVLGGGSPMSTHFMSAITRDWTGHIPVLQVENFIGEDTGKRYKFIQLTSNLLLKANDDNTPIHSYSELCRDLNLS